MEDGSGKRGGGKGSDILRGKRGEGGGIVGGGGEGEKGRGDI